MAGGTGHFEPLIEVSASPSTEVETAAVCLSWESLAERVGRRSHADSGSESHLFCVGKMLRIARPRKLLSSFCAVSRVGPNRSATTAGQGLTCLSRVLPTIRG